MIYYTRSTRVVDDSHNMAGCGSINCAEILRQESTTILGASESGLEKLALQSLRTLAKGSDIVVCVDEVAQLNEAALRLGKAGAPPQVLPAQQVVSLLSKVCHAYYEATMSICTVLVSSLNNSAFETSSGRPVLDWCPDRATSVTIAFLQVN
jgi:hypothetical protein